MRDSECHEAVVSDSEVHKADEVTKVILVGEIDDELDEVSEVDYDEVSEVRPVLNVQYGMSNVGLGRVEDAWTKCLL